MLCMSASVHFVSWSKCACSGSVTTTLGTSPLRSHERIAPDAASYSVMSKSVSLTRPPVTASPEGGVTVARIAVGCAYSGTAAAPGAVARPRGLRNRPCSAAGSYFAPTPLRSPDGEWQELQRPAPVKYASPALG